MSQLLPLPELLVPLRQDWAERIGAAWHQVIDNIFATGRLLIAAKAALPHGEWLPLLDDLPFHRSTAARLMAIAEDPRLSNDAHVQHLLPASWGTLYELTKLDDATFTSRVADGSIHPQLERTDVQVWTQAASRQQRHRAIHAGAVARPDDDIGPFPLIYADPPWHFDVYSDKGLNRSPDRHYPVLTDDEIAGFHVGSRTIPEIAARHAALLLWCTSMDRGLATMRRWGFEYKADAVWVKDKIGLGFVFRNQHEVLLYGTRGNMPSPQYRPPSVFEYPRTQHSAKPPEIRAIIERMYPDFDERTRLELFARGASPGWTSRGFEA